MKLILLREKPYTIQPCCRIAINPVAGFKVGDKVKQYLTEEGNILLVPLAKDNKK